MFCFVFSHLSSVFFFHPPSSLFVLLMKRNLDPNPLRCPLPSACANTDIPSRSCPSCVRCSASGDFQCANGGSCEDGSGACDCPSGFATRDCSVKSDDVAGTVCSGHGTGMLVGEASEPLLQIESCSSCDEGWASNDCSIPCCSGHGACFS